MEPDQATQKPSDIRDAFLVVREGNSWRDVFRLSPAQVMTIGRATTNRIVLRDELCSRNHCELYRNGATWVLRDLGSRNGTMVNNGPVVGERELESGDLIQIGPYELGFTFDLSQPFGSADGTADINNSDTAFAFEAVNESPQNESPQVRRRSSIERGFPAIGPRSPTRPRSATVPTRSWRRCTVWRSIWARRRRAKELAEVVLAGLDGGTHFDIGAVLLLPKAVQQDAKASQLTVVAYTAKGESPYHKVSSYLSTQVLSTREAILARDVGKDTRLSQRDDLGEMRAESVICAPVQLGPLVHGLIHLYSTDPNRPFQPEDLEFTIAVADQMAVALRNLKEKESLASGLDRIRTDYETLRQQLQTESEIVGESPEVEDMRQTIARIAPTDAIVLIRGESGVGKELVARAIHFKSDRNSRPFCTMNCAALAESLLESELFGHEKGPFTGATERKIGKFEQAHRGTLFLDEVGEMSLAIQAKFLRVLEGHPFERVGGRSPVRVDVRVVAATNRNLEREVERGTFRKDLYFRLHVVEIVVTPLRKRRSDIPILAEHFLTMLGPEDGAAGRQLLPRRAGRHDGLRLARQRPGAAKRRRAGRHLVPRRSGPGGRHPTLTALRTPPSDPSITVMDGKATGKSPWSTVEKEHILATLEHTNGNMTRTAEILGIERSTLYLKLKRYDAHRRGPVTACKFAASIGFL